MSVAKEHKLYIRQVWKGRNFEFTCVPNGLSCLPNRFTKLLKPVYAIWRTERKICTGFIDDSLIGANSRVECSKSFDKACSLLQRLGIMINTEDSVVIPIQKLCYINKADMPSREFNDRTEWSLCDNMLKQFAPGSKLQILISLLPGLMLSLKCIVHGNLIQQRSLLMYLCLIGAGFDYCYVFPLFSLLQRCVRKII